MSAPYGRFRARDGFLNIAAAKPAMWPRLAAALGRKDWLQDDRFRDALARLRHRDALTAEIEEALGQESVEHWVTLLNDAGIPAGPVLNLSEVFADPQVRAREMLVELPHPEIGTFRTTGLPVKLSRTPGRITRRPPLHGEHTEEVLLECGLSREEIQGLLEKEVI